MNRLLDRQIKKFLGSTGSIAKGSEPLFKAINDAYDSFDTDRDLMERSLDLSSQELIEANRLLRREADSQKVIMDKLKVAITAIESDSTRFLKGLTSENDLTYLSNVLVRLINEHKYVAQEREALIEKLEKSHRLFKKQTQELEDSRRAIKNVAQDLIKSKRVLEEQKKDLEKTNKELDDFTYIVSHDLKEPLRSIDAFSKFIYDDYKEKLEEEGRIHLERIRANAGRMQALIENLLEVSRIERKKNPFEEVQIEELINEAKLRLEYSIKQKNAEIIIQDKLPKVFCDRVRLTEVFVNLISNAVKFCNKPNPRIKIGLEQKGNFYEFYVKDNGQGIEEQYFGKIFEIFQRLGKREDNEGTGAGLTIVKKIVETHKGKVWVESKIGEGTIFYFTISMNFAKQNKEGRNDKERV